MLMGSSINYYAPDIFKSIGINGSSTSLLASGIYGIVKIVATAIFVFFGIERFGRRWSLTVGLALMSMFLWIIGAIFNTSRESFQWSSMKETNPSSRPKGCQPILLFNRHGRYDLSLRHPLLLLCR